jgi:hypothetical protein
MWRIFVPLRYLQIDHPEKRKFDLYLPLLLAVFFAVPLLSSQFRADALDEFDVLGKFGSFLGVLTGFFVAALAAVATFGKQEMDDLRLEHTVNRVSYLEDLSRRRFLSFLFGYLAFLTLVLFVLGYVYLISDRYFIAVVFPEWRAFIFCIFWMMYVFALGNLLSNSLLGLFYLTDRIHRPNKKAEWGSGADNNKDN